MSLRLLSTNHESPGFSRGERQSESVSHLTEIFHQANSSLYNLVGNNWSNLHLWADYMQDVSGEKEIEDFVAHAKEETGFTDFYFISR